MSTYFFFDETINYMYIRQSVERSVRQRKTKYQRPDLKSWSDRKCKHIFRFTYVEIYRICEAIKLEKVMEFNDLKVDRELAMAILLFRYSFPRRLVDMVSIFGVSEENIGKTINSLLENLLTKFKYDLEFDKRQFSKAIYGNRAFYEVK